MIFNASDSTKRPAHRPLRSTRIVTLSILSMVLALGCGNDGANGTNGGGATNGNGATPFSGAVLCSLLPQPTGGFSAFVRLVSDAELESGEEIDSFEDAVEIAGAGTCVVRGRSVFATSFENPTITRFDEVDGTLVEGQRVSFANFGVTSTLFQPVFISDTKSYYLDIPSLQVIVWNPRAMETIGAIALESPELPEGLRQSTVRTTLIDGSVVLYNVNLTELDTLAARTDFWFIDPDTDEVATDTTDQCGGLEPAVSTATSGDTYIGAGARVAMEHALGLPESFPPCIVRIRAGSREIDRSYTADVNTLAGGLPAGGLIPLGNDRALLYGYDTYSMPINPDLTAGEHVLLENWNLYSWNLGSETPATRIEGISPGPGNVAGLVFDGQAFVLRFSSDLSQTELVRLTGETGSTAFTFGGRLTLLSRLDSAAPATRMAQRIEDRGGLGVLSF